MDYTKLEPKLKLNIKLKLNSDLKPELKKEIILRNYLNESVSEDLFIQLLTAIQWREGIKTRFGKSTRKACMISIDNDLFHSILQYIEVPLRQYNVGNVVGFYLNLYENGEMYTPNHKHIGTNQLVLSLGTSRILKIENKSITLNSGDIIIFGEQLHGVPRTKTHCGQRISIATFCR